MDRWVGIGLFVGGLAWLMLAIAVSDLPAPVWGNHSNSTEFIFSNPRFWPIYTTMSAALLLSGLVAIRRARINGATHGSR